MFCARSPFLAHRCFGKLGVTVSPSGESSYAISTWDGAYMRQERGVGFRGRGRPRCDRPWHRMPTVITKAVPPLRIELRPYKNTRLPSRKLSALQGSELRQLGATRATGGIISSRVTTPSMLSVLESALSHWASQFRAYIILLVRRTFSRLCPGAGAVGLTNQQRN